MELSKYNGDPLQWHEWYGQFKSAIDSQSLTDDVKLTYLKTLVTGKAKTAIVEFAYCCAMYKDALWTIERNFGQPKAVIWTNSAAFHHGRCRIAIPSLTIQGAVQVLSGYLNCSHTIQI